MVYEPGHIDADSDGQLIEHAVQKRTHADQTLSFLRSGSVIPLPLSSLLSFDGLTKGPECDFDYIHFGEYRPFLGFIKYYLIDYSKRVTLKFVIMLTCHQ